MMKKLMGVLLAILVCLSATACGDEEGSSSSKKKTETLTCTKVETDEDGLKTDETVEVLYEGQKILTVKETSFTEMAPETIDFTYSVVSAVADELNKLDGIEAEYTQEENGIKSVMTVDYTKLDVEQMKETFGDAYDDDSIYSSEDMKIDEFKEQYLKDYDCK